MKVRIMLSAVAALATLGMVLLVVGCEDSDLTLPSDGIITLTANPQTITIDPNLGETEGSTTIIASVFDANGNALEDISMLFTTTGGTLASNARRIPTDGNGMAIDTLTVEPGDPSTITVTVQSSATIQLIDITLEVLADNEPPTAAIMDIPAARQEVNKLVTFDGTLSVDPDGDLLTCYQWQINSEIDANDRIIQGPAASGFQETYSDEQEMTVWLRVSDRGDAGSLCDPAGPPVPESMFSPNIAILPYAITCANAQPVADAGADIRQQIGGPPLLLTGCNSSDEEDSLNLDHYEWECGNGSRPDHSGLPDCSVYCTYFAVGTYTARLTVYDHGTGVIDPGTGNWECQKSDTDEVQITIFAPGEGK